MRSRIAALACASLHGSLLLFGCNQILGIEESKVATERQMGGVACDSTTMPCLDGQECIAGHCQAPGDAAMDARVPPVGPPKPDAGGAGTGGAMDAGDAGDSAVPPDTGPVAPMPECESDALRCEGAAQIERSLCVEGFWKATDACENGELCDTTSGKCEPVVAGCSGREPGAAFCTGRERVLCGPDLVTAERETCPTIEHCTGSVDGKCLPCVANEHKCEGNQLQICNADRNGFDLVATCEDAPCNAELRMCTNLVCAADTYSCNTTTNTLRLCNSDGSAFLQETPCNAGICDAPNGQCDVCAPNEFSCMSATDVVSCDGDGQHVTMQTCTELSGTTTPLCNDVMNACVACIAPSSSCIDAAREQNCTAAGTWDTPTTCVDQTCFQGECAGDCGPSVAPRCAAGGGSEACGLNGRWATTESAAQCPVCIGDGVCVACTNGDTKCDGNGRQSTCVGNAWAASTPCTSSTCIGKACTGECSPGTSVCRSDGRYTCDTTTGRFTRAEACTLCQVEPAGARCVVCSPGDYQCTGRDLMRCNNAQTGWDLANRCATAELCDEDAERCIDQDCNPREVLCVNNALETCNATGSAHTTAPACSGTFNICDADGNGGMGQCDRCQENQIGCDSTTARSICSSDGQTVSTPACPSGTPACLNGTCTECHPTATPTKCDGLTRQATCQSNGSWGTPTACVGQTCTATGKKCEGQCAQGQLRCSPTSNTIRESCTTNGFYGDGTTCPGVGGVCIGAGNCVACANGATRCNNTSSQFTCSSNMWGSAQSCTNKTCFGDVGGLGGSCKGNCAPGQRACVAGQRSFRACGGTGEFDTSPTMCGGVTTGSAWEVCRNQAGANSAACIDSPTQFVGFPDAGPNADSTVPLNNYRWLMQPVTVTADIKLFGLSASIDSLVAQPPTLGMQMVIYTQRAGVGGAPAQPDVQVAITALTSVTTQDNNLATLENPILTPGTYWVGVKVYNGTPASASAVGQLDAYTVVTGGPFLWYTPSPANAALPTTFPAVTVRSGFQLGVWLRGKYLL